MDVGDVVMYGVSGGCVKFERKSGVKEEVGSGGVGGGGS